MLQFDPALLVVAVIVLTISISFYVWQLSEETKKNIKLEAIIDEQRYTEQKLMLAISALGSMYPSGRAIRKKRIDDHFVENVSTFVIDLPDGQLQVDYTEDYAFAFKMHPVYSGAIDPDPTSYVGLMSGLTFSNVKFA